MRIRQRAFTLLKLVITVSLLGFLFKRIGIGQILTMLNSTNSAYLAAIFGMLILDTVLRAYNWSILLRIRSAYPPLPEVIYTFLVGGFFGTLIPSSVGTDVARAFLIAKRNHIKAADSTSAIIVLNLMGLLSLCVLALGSSLVLLSTINDRSLVVATIVVCLAYILLFPLLVKGRVPVPEFTYPPIVRRTLSKMQEFSGVIRSFADQKAALVAVFCIAALNQVLGVLLVYTVSLFLDLRIPIGVFFAFVPVIALTRIIPLSIAGLGAEQGIFVLLFYQAGIPSAEAFLISFILSAANVSYTLVGGLAYGADSLYSFLTSPRSAT